MELWDLVKDAAGVSIHRMLRSRGLDALLAEDLLQEFFIYLKAHDLRLLRGFQGTCEPQFRAFLRIAASRFALRTLRVWQRNQRREIAAWTAAPPLRAGPTEEQIRQAVGELESVITSEDREKLRMISECPDLLPEEVEAEKHRPAAAPRTLRHWRGELLQRYAGRLV